MKLLCLLFLLTIAVHCHLAGQADEFQLLEKYKALADSFGAVSQYAKAIQYNKRALNICQNMRPVPFGDLVRLYRSTGSYYRRWGQYDQSAFHLRRAVEIAEQHLDANHPELADACNSYGILFLMMGDYERSLYYLNKALDINLQSKNPAAANQFNNIGIVYENQGNFEEALGYYQKALEINLATLGKFHLETANNYNNLGTLSSNNGRYDEALAFFDSTLVIYDSLLPAHDPNRADLYNNLGALLTNKGDLRTAIYYLEKSLDIYKNTLGSKHPDVANAYANIGILHMDRGDFGKALSYFQQAYAIRTAAFGKIHPLVARTCNYLGNCFLELQDFEQAGEWLNLGLQIRLQQPGGDPGEIADSRNDLGLFFEKTGNLDEAMFQYLESLRLNSRRLGKKHPDVANSFERLGSVVLAQKNYLQAKEYFEKSLEIRLVVFGNKHPQVASLYQKLALACPHDEVCAMEYLDSAFAALAYRPAVANSFDGVLSPTTLLETLQAKGELLQGFFKQTGDSERLKEADQTYRTALSLIDFIKTTLAEPGSKQALLNRFFLVYEAAIFVKYHLKKLTGETSFWHEAFEIAERSNATLLLEALKAAETKQFAGIPDSLLTQEHRLKIDLSFYEKLRFEEQLKGTAADRQKINALTGKIFDLQNSYHHLTELLRENYPAYFELKYSPQVTAVPEIQHSLLRPDQTMLAYFVGENSIFVFVISREAFHMAAIEKDYPLEAWIEEFRNSIYRFNPADRELEYLHQKFANIGHELFQLLLEPVKPHLTKSSLVIVPGGVLGYLPFEAILASPPQSYGSFDSHDYLVRHFQISYTYSATLLKEMLQSSKRHSVGKMMAFAPSYRGDTLAIRSDPWRAVLGQLRHNVQEAITVQSIMGGKVFLDSFATEQKFREVAPKAGFLHLATHGKANDRHGEYSYLAFYQIADSIENELLFVKDLYNMRIKAALVVLSACETGIGEWQRGEGIISLARGFFYAGASSIVTTLWSIDDNASAGIMECFYRNLKAGKTKDASLRLAKLHYLEKEKGSNRCHPLFWAGFVPVGNMEAVSTGFPWWTWLLLIAVAAVFFILLKKRIRSFIS